MANIESLMIDAIHESSISGLMYEVYEEDGGTVLFVENNLKITVYSNGGEFECYVYFGGEPDTLSQIFSRVTKDLVKDLAEWLKNFYPIIRKILGF